MHVDSLATNAARNVIEPLDDVAKALELKQEDFADVVWKAGEYNGKRYGIPLDVHPLGLLLQQDADDAGRPRPGEAADEPPTSTPRRWTRLKGKGIQGHWATPFPFTGVLTVQALLWQFGGDLFNAGLVEGDLARGARRQGADLVRRPGEERPQPEERRARTRTTSP